MSTATLQVLFLGDSRPLEMRRAFACVERAATGGMIEQVANVEQAVSLIAAADWYPDLVIVFQSWPDQFGAAEVQKLIGMLPLARWVCCFGAWCESDGRNKAIWPQSIRVPARSAEWRIRDELWVLADRRNALPLTASRDEIFGFDHSEHVMDVSVDLPVCVISADAAFRLYLQDLLRAANCRIENSQNASAAGIVVWDADP